MEKDFINQLVENPRESLSVELKNWIDPNSPKDIAKIVKTVLAMRNYGGGFLLIGFNDKSCEPDFDNVPTDVRSIFHIDKIQSLITKYSSEPFEIKIHFPVLKKKMFPVLEIPSGIKSPVATKSCLIDNGSYLIKENKIYIRSLKANNTPSTTEATWQDWGRIVETCFDNREADIGRFLRRHLSGSSVEIIRDLLSTFSNRGNITETSEDKLYNYLEKGNKRLNAIIKEKKIKLPEYGTWEVALSIFGNQIKFSANKDFLNLLDSNNPNYTGWPIWLNSWNFKDTSCKPYVYEGGWEAFIHVLNISSFTHIDFWRLEPEGNFYLWRVLEDDISKNAPKTLTVLDFKITILRLAEALAVGISFAKAMGSIPNETELAFGFRWSKLKGRELTCWSEPSRHLMSRRIAYQDEVFSNITLTLDTPLSALSQYVYSALKPVFEIFDGFEISINLVEEFTERLLERRH